MEIPAESQGSPSGNQVVEMDPSRAGNVYKAQAAPPRQERDERMEQPEGGGPNTYGKVKVAASRCPAPRDSPALSRQEGDD